MFLIKVVLSSITIVLFSLKFISSEVCVYAETSDNVYNNTENNYVECRNVHSMHELAAVMRSNWHRLKIINNVDSFFTNAEHPNQYLQYIQHLDLSEAGILHMSDHGFRDFAQLIQLNMSHTRTAVLKNNWFSRNNNIQFLDISWNKLTTLRREDFRTLTKLLSVNISHNEIENIETLAFSDLKRLKELNLQNNRIENLIDWGDLSSMEVLNLDDNFLTKIPANGFSKLRALHTLTLSQNSIYDLEKDCFNGLAKLRKLNLSGNSIKTIQNDLFQGFSRIRLQELDFNNNDISVIESNAFEYLNFLQILDLSGNAIKDINENTFMGLNALRKLFFFNNDISNIQGRTFAELNNLEELDLSGNSLQSFSGDMFGVSSAIPKKLRKLLLKRNNLLVIQPHSFDHITNLDYLSFSFNEIVRLDENLLLPLNKLKKLHMNHNKIQEIPGILLNAARKLQELYIDHNKLTFFPDVTNDFRNLVKVSFEGNPWQCACLNDLIAWVTRRGIDYCRSGGNPYYDGLKPICVVTNVCVKDASAAEQQDIVTIYENALS